MLGYKSNTEHNRLAHHTDIHTRCKMTSKSGPDLEEILEVAQLGGHVAAQRLPLRGKLGPDARPSQQRTDPLELTQHLRRGLHHEPQDLRAGWGGRGEGSDGFIEFQWGTRGKVTAASRKRLCSFWATRVSAGCRRVSNRCRAACQSGSVRNQGSGRQRHTPPRGRCCTRSAAAG